VAVSAHDRVGSVLDGRFALERLVGRGAMADVYQATDVVGEPGTSPAGSQVAIKILRQALARDAGALKRFEREAQVQAMIRHRNVAALLGSGVTDRGEPYLVVELLRGKSLRTVIKTETRVSAPRATSYIWQALKGLAAVHERQVLHRDLKPANLMLEPSPGPVERVVLIDFGFAALEGGAKLTQQGHVVGSLTYLAPERLRGEAGDERSDLYAMGVILFELLAGVPPFTGSDDFELISMHLSEPPPRFIDAVPGLEVPRPLERIIEHAMAKIPEDRYATALEMAAALEEVAQVVAP
jgi:serine/threonine protein kinase